jgi:hypothetical protein
LRIEMCNSEHHRHDRRFEVLGQSPGHIALPVLKYHG